jgi:excisionase family DNA binding protein
VADLARAAREVLAARGAFENGRRERRERWKWRGGHVRKHRRGTLHIKWAVWINLAHPHRSGDRVLDRFPVIETPSDTPQDPPTLSVADVAGRLAVSPTTVRSMVTRGDLAGYRLPGRGLLRFRESEVAALLHRSSTGGDAA